jgi:pimeloyl-ACP methyl ester carboxylesterase
MSLRATVPGATLEYEIAGDGPDLVWCHGLGGSLEDGRAAAERVAAKGYRVLWYSCRGAGRSTPVTTRDECGYGPIADDLEALLDVVGFERPLLAGGSHGANTILRHEQRHPGRAAALLLIAPGANALGRIGGPRWWLVLGAYHRARRKGMPGLVKLITGKDAGLVDDPMVAAALTHDPASLAVSLRHIPDQGAVEPAALASFAVPAHVAAWDKDPLIHPIALARRIAELIPGATFEEIRRVTTLTHEETAEVAADLISRWAATALAAG